MPKEWVLWRCATFKCSQPQALKFCDFCCDVRKLSITFFKKRSNRKSQIKKESARIFITLAFVVQQQKLRLKTGAIIVRAGHMRLVKHYITLPSLFSQFSWFYSHHIIFRSWVIYIFEHLRNFIPKLEDIPDCWNALIMRWTSSIFGEGLCAFSFMQITCK